jgi:hypothetical protein
MEFDSPAPVDELVVLSHDRALLGTSHVKLNLASWDSVALPDLAAMPPAHRDRMIKQVIAPQLS